MLANITSQQRTRFDLDARAYIDAVHTADGQALEYGVQWALNQLVIDLKAASLWSLIGTMVVKMGARTLTGALINLKNPASSWTNGGFVSADYNRTTGLIGNGTSKFLNSLYANNANGQNDQSLWTYVTALSTGTSDVLMGSTIGSGGTTIGRASATDINFTSRSLAAATHANAHAVGLIGLSRDNSANYVSRGGQASQTNTRTSATPNTNPIYDYGAYNAGTALNPSDHRSCISGIGAAMDLAALETILATFISRITALSL